MLGIESGGSGSIGDSARTVRPTCYRCGDASGLISVRQPTRTSAALASASRSLCEPLRAGLLARFRGTSEMATMLNVQQYLRDGNPLGALAAELGIAAFRHPELPLVGLKYQSQAPKAHPLVRDCRGLVLEADSWDVVAKPFDRFYNAGEDPDAFADFNWSRSTCQAKEDGSLLIVYAYRGAWHVNTSGSFGHAEVAFSGRTWAQLFWAATSLEPGRLDARSTYVFELGSPYTEIVRPYPQTTAYLLSLFETATCREWGVEAADE